MSLLLIYAPAAIACGIFEGIAKHTRKRKTYRPGKVQRFAQ